MKTVLYLISTILVSLTTSLPQSSSPSCYPNPCARGADCRYPVGYGRAVSCTCKKGYFGNALIHCTRGECLSDVDCPSYLACMKDYTCRNPCVGTCATNARCKVVNHGPVCSCPPNYVGNPSQNAILTEVDIFQTWGCGVG